MAELTYRDAVARGIAQEMARDPDVVFLGDSTCRCSIDPAVFQKASGLSAYNLGSMGALGADGFQLILEL